MKFEKPLIEARLIRRYQRFFVDADLNGEVITAHCPNSGAMIGVKDPGLRVWLTHAPSPKRKLAYTIEFVEVDNGKGEMALVGVNTSHPNRLIEDAIKSGGIAELSGYGLVRREVRYGENSRIDLLLEQGQNGAPPCYVEVKNVHMSREAGLAEFPDSVTSRGAKHLRELSDMVKGGHRAVMVFCVQRADCTEFALASDIDPAYAKAFDEATQAGVETLVYTCHISPQGITVGGKIPFQEKK